MCAFGLMDDCRDVPPCACIGALALIYASEVSPPHRVLIHSPAMTSPPRFTASQTSCWFHSLRVSHPGFTDHSSMLRYLHRPPTAFTPTTSLIQTPDPQGSLIQALFQG